MAAADNAYTDHLDHGTHGYGSSVYARLLGYETYWRVVDNGAGPGPLSLTMDDWVNRVWGESPAHEGQQLSTSWHTVGMAVAWDRTAARSYASAVFGPDTSCP